MAEKAEALIRGLLVVLVVAAVFTVFFIPFCLYVIGLMVEDLRRP